MIEGTCVLESDFGFILNCAFKKSGLFRVRNLGGIKAHVGLGFSLGDELGFRESISNTEVNRRRSAQASSFTAQAALAQQQKSQVSVRAATPYQESTKQIAPSNDGKPFSVPPFKPIPPAAERPAVIQSTNTTRYSAMTAPALSGIMVVPNRAQSLPIQKSKSAANRNDASTFALRALPANGGNELNLNSIQPFVGTADDQALLEAALLKRQQQYLQKISSTSTTTTTTSTHRPKHSTITNIGKVMNAPKEYYPVGYDKNFDDNFASSVELPETSFYCGDQKHFPGLYADEDLGCMVFHVCALTDEGLIMKSFLCPESTLFDQSVLKCNFWFYVDCKSSRKLYDSNIPISKSYQLMKALTFFSSYRKDAAAAVGTKEGKAIQLERGQS